MKMTEEARLKSHLYRASGDGLPATLTMPEWRRTLADFHDRCAYCGSADIDVLEHFVPISRGGGTTPGNCLPACEGCDSRKAGKMPDDLDATFGAETMRGLRLYLAGRSTGVDVVPKPARVRHIHRIDGVMTSTKLSHAQRASVEAIVDHRRRTTSRCGYNVSDALREAVNLLIAANPLPAPKRKRAPKGGAQ